MRGAIFDVDGTLVDSNDEHARAFADAFRAHGRDVAFADVRRLIGMGGDKLVPAAIGPVDAATHAAIEEHKGKVFREEFLKTLRPFPGAAALVAALRARGLKLGVASSASREDLEALLEIAQVTSLLRDAASADDAAESKPDPDIVLAALDLLELPPSDVFLIGDTPYDVEAASRAGVAAVAFRCGGLWTDEDLAGAIAIYDGPWDLLAQLEGAPFLR